LLDQAQALERLLSIEAPFTCSVGEVSHIVNTTLSAIADYPSLRKEEFTLLATNLSISSEEDLSIGEY
jgi:hypothetical protein